MNQPSYTTSKFEDRTTNSLRLRVSVEWPDGFRDSVDEPLADLSQSHTIFSEDEQAAEDRLRRLLQRRRKKS